MGEPIQDAHSIYGDIESSMSDLASGSGEFTDYEDIEAEADRIWNDPKELRDILGDRIFWATANLTDKEAVSSLCTDLIVIGHDAFKQAVREFMKDHDIEEK